jgi:hypothetical protein
MGHTSCKFQIVCAEDISFQRKILYIIVKGSSNFSNGSDEEEEEEEEEEERRREKKENNKWRIRMTRSRRRLP